MSLVEQALRRMRQFELNDRRSRALSAPITASKDDSVELPAIPSTDVIDSAATLEARPTIHVDIASLRAAGLLPPESRERLVARQFRHIKLSLVNAAKEASDAGAQYRLIMVASALPGEGKTFCVVNLALSMARERDTEVLIVDADVAKPHISHAFGVADEPGLVDVLTNKLASIEDLILPTDIDGFRILPAGRFEEDTATELLSSARMKQITAQIASAGRRRIAVFDTPPLLLTTEARVLAGLMGQIVLVVRAGVTPKQSVYEAIAALGEDKAIGLVFNQSTSRATDGYSTYYGDGGSASYGDYGTYGKVEATVDTRGAGP